MYNVLIADDEPLVLNAISKNINWANFGFNHPMTCDDGQAAIELLSSGFKPDLIITDICMPYNDGFDIITKSQELKLDPKIIILSGYDDFKYAQRAIKCSVYDYLVKPITPKQINALLEIVKKELDKPKLEDMEKYMQSVAPFFLSRWLTRPLDKSIIDSSCKIHGLNFKGNSYNIVLVDVDFGRIMDAEQSNTHELYQFALQNIVHELTSSNNNNFTFSISDGITAIIFYDEDNTSLQKNIKTTCDNIIIETEKFLKVNIFIGIGKVVYDIYSFYQSYTIAKKSLFYRFLYDTSKIIEWSKFNRNIQQGDFDYRIYENQILDGINKINKTLTYSGIDSFISNLIEKQITLDKSIIYSQNIIISIVNKTFDISGEKYIEQYSDDQINLFAISNLENLSTYIKKICENSFDLLTYKEQNSTSILIKKAEKYIKDNYGNSDLTLNSITEYVCLSISHFSNIFKLNTGYTFVEYLTNIRIEQAKKELLFTDKKAYQISDDVGFADSHYFSIVFKRVTGLTPKQFRENLQYD